MRRQTLALVVFLLILFVGMVAMYLFFGQEETNGGPLDTSVSGACSSVWMNGDSNCGARGQQFCISGGIYTCYPEGQPYSEAYSTADGEVAYQICGEGLLKTGTACSSCGDGICSVAVINGKAYNEEDVCAQDCEPAAQAPVCGDGVCNLGESCGGCSLDCGSCPAAAYQPTFFAPQDEVPPPPPTPAPEPEVQVVPEEAVPLVTIPNNVNKFLDLEKERNKEEQKQRRVDSQQLAIGVTTTTAAAGVAAYATTQLGGSKLLEQFFDKRRVTGMGPTPPTTSI